MDNLKLESEMLELQRHVAELASEMLRATMFGHGPGGRPEWTSTPSGTLGHVISQF